MFNWIKSLFSPNIIQLTINGQKVIVNKRERIIEVLRIYYTFHEFLEADMRLSLNTIKNYVLNEGFLPRSYLSKNGVSISGVTIKYKANHNPLFQHDWYFNKQITLSSF